MNTPHDTISARGNAVVVPSAVVNGQTVVVTGRLRRRYPRKLDFCRMTLEEFAAAVDRVAQEDRQRPQTFKPLVAIGHTKDLVDIQTIESFLDHLERRKIPVSTFQGAYDQCRA